MSAAASLQSDFKQSMASWATGVSVVSTRAGGLVYGMTVSSLTSLSLDPPLILVCLSRASRLSAMIEDASAFAASILADDQDAISNHFATPGRMPAPAFEAVETEWSRSGMPVVAGAAAYLACDLHALLPQGDHHIVIGRVNEAATRHHRNPLLYFRRRYRFLDQHVEAAPVHEFETLMQSF